VVDVTARQHTEFALYVPTRLNSGAPVSDEFFSALETRLASVAGGYTLTLGVGAFTMPGGAVQREDVRVYTMIMASHASGAGTLTASGAARLLSIAEHVKIQLAQVSVLLTARAIAAEFV
jgi:hypothetical protein